MWATPCRRVKTHERIVARSKTTRLGKSKENLKAERGGLITCLTVNGEEGRAKPMRRYTGFLIKLCRAAQLHEGMTVEGNFR